MSDRSEVARKIEALYGGTPKDEFASGLEELLDDAVDALIWCGAEAIEPLGAPATCAAVAELDAAHRSVVRNAGFVAASPTVVAIWATVTAEAPDGRVGKWMTQDVFKLDRERVRSVRFQADTLARQAFAPKITDAPVYAGLAANWRPQTTAANRVGMQQLLALRWAPMSADERATGVLGLLAQDVSQTSCEKDGIVVLPDRDAIAKMFYGSRLLEMYPDFYQAVVDVEFVGNCLVTLQVPSGHAFGLTDHFDAWYNADAFLFDGPTISHMHFMRDTLWADDLLQAAIRAQSDPA